MSETTELQIPETSTLETAPEVTAPIAPETDAPQERQPSPRELAMERILARRQEVIAQEVAHAEILAADARALAGTVEPSLAEPTPSTEQAPEAPTEAAGEVAVVVPQPQAAPAPVPAQASALFDVDVPGYGRMQVTHDQLLHLASVGAVANAAMRQPPAVVPSPTPAPAAPLVDEDRARAFAKSLAYGDETEAVRAVQALVTDVASRLAAPQINQDVIINEAVQRTMHANQFVSNMQTIGAEFPDIFGKPDEADPAALARHHRLSRLAALELTDLRQRYAALGQARADLDLYREAANNVRATIGTPPQPRAETESPALQAAPSPTRLERKRAAPQNPTAVSRTASLGPVQPQTMTGSQIVAAMRKARGQMPMH